MKSRPIIFSSEMIRALLAEQKTQTRRIIKPQPSEHWLPYSYGEIHKMVDGDFVMRNGDPVVIGWGPCNEDGEEGYKCKYGKPGDYLWVRETFAVWDGPIAYLADSWCNGHEDLDNKRCRLDYGVKWKPSIHMPRKYSRITLKITNIRVERVQDITEHDAIAEGCEAKKFPGPWWQGYKEFNGEKIYQQHCGKTHPDWMIDPRRMKDTRHLDRSAANFYRGLWNSLNAKHSSWSSNPWVWVIEFEVIRKNIMELYKSLSGFSDWLHHHWQ